MFRQERGAALIVAMLIVSIVVILAGTLTFENQLALRLFGNQLLFEQSYQYLRATEEIAAKVLRKDAEDDISNEKRVDKLDELWAQEAPPFMLENGAYTGKLIDLQGRFNINSLVNKSRDPYQAAAFPETAEQAIFMRLLLSVNDDDWQLDSYQAKAITAAIVDYIDADSLPIGFECGEDAAYYGIEGRRPHRTANQPLQSVSELLLVCNMPLPLYYRIRQLVTVWPLDGKETINLNTASDALLRSVLVHASDSASIKQAVKNKQPIVLPEPISQEDIEQFREKLSNKGYDNFASLEKDIEPLQLWPDAKLGLYSDYFLLQAQAKLGDLETRMDSVFYRKNGNISIFARSVNGL